MANNITVTPGTGATVAAENIANVLYGQVKLIDATAGSTTPVGTTANPLKVDASGVLVPVSQSGTWTIQPGNTANTTPWLMKPYGTYNSVTPSLTNGQTSPFQMDAYANTQMNFNALLFGEDSTNNVVGVTQKPLAASTYSPTKYFPLTQVTKANIKSTSGNVLAFYITNANATVRYFQLHNKASAPAAADVPSYSFPVSAGTANNPGVLILGVDFFTAPGVNFSTGIGWAISTTFGTFTDSATNTDHIVSVLYV